MLPVELDQQFNAFYSAVYADGELDGKTKVLLGMAVAMAIGCYP
jgi:alkylhydroperoxidase/carboxymuconolactone decarboxylase family protein YurZ